MNKLTTLLQIQKCIEEVKKLIGKLASATVEVISEIEEKISDLEDMVGLGENSQITNEEIDELFD